MTSRVITELGAMPPDALSDRAWADLELDGVFRIADHCASATGQQILYALLRRPQRNPAEIARRDAIVQALNNDPRIKEDVRRALSKLSTRSAYSLQRLFTASFRLGRGCSTYSRYSASPRSPAC